MNCLAFWRYFRGAEAVCASIRSVYTHNCSITTRATTISACYPKTHLTVNNSSRRTLSGNVPGNLIRVNAAALLADDFARADDGPCQCHGPTGAYVSRGQCSSCVTDLARDDGWSSNVWRSASWLSCRFSHSCDLDCSGRRARRDFTARGNRWTGSRSVVQSAAEDVTNQFAEPQRDCVQVESVEDIPMRLYEC